MNHYINALQKIDLKNFSIKESKLFFKEVNKIIKKNNEALLNSIQNIVNLAEKKYNIERESYILISTGSLATKTLVPSSDLDLAFIGKNLNKDFIIFINHKLQNIFTSVSVNILNKTVSFYSLEYRVLLGLLFAEYLSGSKLEFKKYKKKLLSFYQENKNKVLKKLVKNISKRNPKVSLEFNLKISAGGLREQQTLKSLAEIDIDFKTLSKKISYNLEELIAIRAITCVFSQKSPIFNQKNFNIKDFKKYRANLLCRIHDFAILYRKYLREYFNLEEFKFVLKPDEKYILQNKLSFKHKITKNFIERFYYSGKIFDIEEFSRLKGQAKTISFHKYPVPMHSIETALNLFNIIDGKVYEKSDFFTKIIKSLNVFDFNIIVYASIFHDIGKYNKNHPVVGANIIKTKYYKTNSKYLDKIVSLIKNHLLIHEYASKKNISNPLIIEEFLSIVSKDNLDLLFLLTYLDMLASYGSVNKWYLELYFLFYTKIKNYITKDKIGETTKMIEIKQEGEITSLYIKMKQDVLGTFYSILNVLSKFGGDIFYASIQNSKKFVNDEFKLKGLNLSSKKIKELENSLEKQINSIDNINLKDLGLIIKNIKSFKFTQEKSYTVLEVKVEDRENLLLDISKLFFFLGINLEFATISSIKRDAIDVFHLTKNRKNLSDNDIDDLKKLCYDKGNLRRDINILQIIEENLSFVPVIDEMKLHKEDPFKILVTILMSARTKDETSAIASEKLFDKVKTPQELIKLSEKEIADLIYPVGFYKTKAKHIKELSKILINDFNSKIPNNLDDLLKLPGVGLKTASLVMATVFDEAEVCVDTHVHRISNRARLNFVDTKNTVDTHYALKEYFPSVIWQKINYILVSFGKTVCKPIGPKCNICKVNQNCSYFSKRS